MIEQVNELLRSMGFNSSWADKTGQIVVLLLIIGVAFLGDLVCRHVVLRLISKLVQKTKATWDDVVFDRKVMIHISHLVPPVLIYGLIPLAVPLSETLDFIQRLCFIYMIAVFLRFFNVFLAAIYHVYSDRDQFRDRPLKGLLQTAQIVAFFVGGIGIISLLINRSPVVLLTGLGASAAILILVFKDSILGFVSGIQLAANNMLMVGDWITMPKYGADGTVVEVTLTTVKVRNWDNTITTLPPYALVSDSFQNWRGMRESGGRRIKRSINIDMNSVRFCTPAMLERYIQLDRSLLLAGRRQTNLGVFRLYLTNYLHALPEVNKELTCMVRQLQPTEHGIPLELYFFSSIKDWMPYEALQADVFDHLLAIIPEFDLRVFQSPSSFDFHIINNN